LDHNPHTGALEDATYARVGSTLLYGLLVSVTVMVAGLVFDGIKGQAVSGHVLTLDRVIPHLVSGDPSAVLDTGILLLFATPLAAVIVALVEFLRVGDRAFAGITLAVGVLLCAGFVVALH
jgi:uncharacterized membrane protein